MNKAVIYFGATGNEAADQMVMQVLEEYCTVNGYEVVAVICLLYTSPIPRD